MTLDDEADRYNACASEIENSLGRHYGKDGVMNRAIVLITMAGSMIGIETKITPEVATWQAAMTLFTTIMTHRQVIRSVLEQAVPPTNKKQ